ncbi:MAG: hypothetical protein V7K47_00300 [Nostoc sp.]
MLVKYTKTSHLNPFNFEGVTHLLDNCYKRLMVSVTEYGLTNDAFICIHSTELLNGFGDGYF